MLPASGEQTVREGDHLLSGHFGREVLTHAPVGRSSRPLLAPSRAGVPLMVPSPQVAALSGRGAVSFDHSRRTALAAARGTTAASRHDLLPTQPKDRKCQPSMTRRQ